MATVIRDSWLLTGLITGCVCPARGTQAVNIVLDLIATESFNRLDNDDPSTISTHYAEDHCRDMG